MASDASLGEREVYEFQYSPPSDRLPGDRLAEDRLPEIQLPEIELSEMQRSGSRLPEERRDRERSVLRVQARILVDNEAIEADTMDLSPHGVAVTATRPLNIDQECSIELGITIASLVAPPMLRASVRYCAQLTEGRFRIGMKFTTVSIEAAELIVEALEL
jgi:hypothetical protein